MRSARLIPLLFLLAASGPAPLHIIVTEAGGRLTAKVHEQLWFGLPSSLTPCVHDVTLQRKADEKVIWRTVVDSQRRCRALKTFEIGRAPPGFRDEVSLSIVLSKGDYRLTADGVGFGTRDFTLPLNPEARSGPRKVGGD